jgi:hypothetical protein
MFILRGTYWKKTQSWLHCCSQILFTNNIELGFFVCYGMFFSNNKEKSLCSWGKYFLKTFGCLFVHEANILWKHFVALLFMRQIFSENILLPFCLWGQCIVNIYDPFVHEADNLWKHVAAFLFMRQIFYNKKKHWLLFCSCGRYFLKTL